MIDTIDSVLDIDLSEDQLLVESLMLHMRSAIFLDEIFDGDRR